MTNKNYIKPGVDFIEFNVYRAAVKRAYENMVQEEMSKGISYALATNVAYAYYRFDIEAVRNGEISDFSSIPGFRRY